jgi:hypothetical protein
MGGANLLFCLFGVFAAALAGCAAVPTVNEPETLNQGLTYLPWSVSPNPGSGHTTYVLTPHPGMQLRLSSEYTDRHAANVRPPIFSQATWIVPPHDPVSPTTDYSASDRIFLSWLLQGALPANAHPTAPADPLAEAFRATQAAPSFNADFLDLYYGRILRSLIVEYTPNTLTNQQIQPLRFHAAWVRALACHADRPDPDPTLQAAAQALAFRVPSGRHGSTLFRNYNWTSFWALEPIAPLPNSATNSEYYPNPDYVSQGRGLLDVGVPIRFDGAPTSIFVSICTTVQALEAKWGVEVLGLRRYRGWLPDALQVPAGGMLTSGPDQYITVRFAPAWDAFEWISGVWPIDATALQLQKDDLLLAPGDIIFARRRFDRASDVPPGWMDTPLHGDR